MGMVLEHELSAWYAAGSLGGTLGRLTEAVKRLPRPRDSGPGVTAGNEAAAYEPLRLALLNQTQRLMADAWQARNAAASRQFNHLEELLDSLKETALIGLGSRRKQQVQQTYQILAQALANLKRLEQLRM
ncbi:MAG: hypothetical protein LBV79_00435 [Candidatus Adiutrix sp.]|nr:hypothetical protein [Candidatus Adiutrix sp.]